MKKLSILLVDDHEVVRAGFKILLAAQEDIDPIYESNCGESVVHLYQKHKPDVVVMDLSMPGIGGMESIRRLKKYDKLAKVLVYSIHDESIYLERAMLAGANGYVSKNSAAETLADAVRAVAVGQRYIEQSLLPEVDDVRTSEYYESKLITDLLSPREFEVFCRLAKGMTVHAISDELHLGYKTVANYSTQVKSKLKVTTAAEIANIAMVAGVINPSV